MRLRAAADQPMEEGVVTYWEAEAKASRQQVVDLQGQQKSSVFSRVAASHPVQSSVEAEQMVQERAAKRRACGEEVPSSHHLLEEWFCREHLELRDALEIGDSLIISELTKLLAAGAAKIQAMLGAT